MPVDGLAEARFVKRSWSATQHWRERRANSLLLRERPPVAFPPLIAASRRRRELVFEAVDGEALGPKYPAALPAADVDGLVDLALAMDRYRPSLARPARLPLARYLDGTGLRWWRQFAAADPPRWRFTHADVICRNVLRRASDGALVLVDWEWAGLYPRGWELAMVWYALADVPGGRARVEAAVPSEQRTWFWRCALLIVQLHLVNFVDDEHRPRHERVRDALLRQQREDQPGLAEVVQHHDRDGRPARR